MDPIISFKQECEERIKGYASNIPFQSAKRDFMIQSTPTKYSYNFTWMGRPIIQYPQDMVAMQELLWEVKPDLVVETGIAHGGSLVYSASILALLEMTGAIENGRVLGIDIDIREHNRMAIESHPMASRIDMIEGSSIDPAIIDRVHKHAKKHSRILVCLDSNHTHDHVLAELQAYAPLVTIGSYCVVFDTIIEDLPVDSYPDRPWNVGNNPKTAVFTYLKDNDNFTIDTGIDSKLLISVAPHGYLKRIK